MHMGLINSSLQAIGLFLVTNIDDIIVLSLFFGRGAGRAGTTARIAAGQYLGFITLVVISVIAALGLTDVRVYARPRVAWSTRTPPTGARLWSRAATLTRSPATMPCPLAPMVTTASPLVTAARARSPAASAGPPIRSTA